MWGSDYRIRLHLSRNDSHSNEAERTNSAMADSVVNGQRIEWEFHKLFDGISADKIEAMTLQEFERHQDERMKLNAYMVRDEVVKRIDGASCLKEEIVAYPSPDDPFFFNKAEIYKHRTASNPNGDSKIPGIFYFQKITEDYRSYIQKHYHVGQLYMHFLKDRCDESGSGSCSIFLYGQTIEWEFHKLFDGISADKIEAMTLQEFERHQDERVKLNAYMVRDEVVKRIDGASCLKEDIIILFL